MNDFITAVRDEQLKLSERIITALRRTILLGRQRKLQHEIRDANETVDKTALHLLIESELRRDVLTALIGYTDWLATKLWRDIAYITEPTFTVPRCDDRGREQIVVRYGCPRDVLDGVAEFIRTNEVTLPVVGKIANENLTLDRDALAQWASFFDWS